jgi:hypothetical protein
MAMPDFPDVTQLAIPLFIGAMLVEIVLIRRFKRRGAIRWRACCWAPAMSSRACCSVSCLSAF